MSVSEVAEITKIRSTYLRALEDGRYSEFSSEVHLQGFLSNYAKFLGLDISRIRALYRRERKIKPETLKTSMFTSKDKPRFILTARHIVFPIIALAVIGVFIYFVKQYRAIAEPPSLSISEPQENAVTISSTVLVKGQVEPGNILTINNQEVTAIDSLGFFETYIKLNIEGVNKITIVAESGLGKKTVIERTVTYQPAPTEQLTIKIVSNSSRPVDYSIAKDNQPAESKTISPDGEFSTGAIATVTITINDPSLVRVFANNQQVTLYKETVVTLRDGNIVAEPLE